MASLFTERRRLAVTEPDIKLAWFLRLPTDVIDNPYIMDNASATDWRVLLAIARRQGYLTRRTFPLYIDKTAEEAHCSRRTAIRSISWWVKVGALIKTKLRRINVYEIPEHFMVSSGMSASPRHKTPRDPKRGDMGRYVPSAVTCKVPARGTCMVPAHGTPNQKSYSEVFNENPPPPPTGGNGRSSEASARPSFTIKEDTIRELIKAIGKERVLDILKKGNYPIPKFLLGEEETVSPESQAHDPQTTPDQKEKEGKW